MSNDGVNAGRRRFLVAATSVVGAAGAVGAAVPFVGSWFPSAKAKAAGAPVQVNVGKIDPATSALATAPTTTSPVVSTKASQRR